MTIHILSLKKSLYIELMNDMAAFRISIIKSIKILNKISNLTGYNLNASTAFIPSNHACLLRIFNIRSKHYHLFY